MNTRTPSLPRRLAAILVVGLLAPGCKSLSLQDLPWPSQLGWLKNFLAERDEVTYYPTARENFRRGMELYIKEDWQDAAKYFDYVRTKFPHSRYAVIAELRLADAHFGKEKWLDSIDSYRAFIRLHPTHEAVGYATFQIAKAHHRQIPEEWFFLPSVSERDQSAAQDAVRAFDDFLIRFPDHERAEEARKLRKAARTRLASHERYAASYYLRSHPKGAAFRYERVADLYPDVDHAADGLMRAAEIWEKDGDLRRARLDFERVARDYPKDVNAKRARTAADRLARRMEEAERAELQKKQREEAEALKKAAALNPDAGTPATEADEAEEEDVEEDAEEEPDTREEAGQAPASPGAPSPGESAPRP